MLAGVVGVEDLGDGLGVGAELGRLGVIAGVEGLEVEGLLARLGAPEAQAVDGLALIAHDGHVVRDGLDELAALLGVPELATLALVTHDVAAEAHVDGALGVLGLPREALVEPVVGDLHLTAALDLLLEEAVLVAHAVAEAQDALGGHGVEEARGEAAQATVAQARVLLLGDKLVEVDAHGLEPLGHDVADAVVEQVAVEQRANKELEREVIDLLELAPLVLRVAAGEPLVGLLRDEAREGTVALRVVAVLEALAGLGA